MQVGQIVRVSRHVPFFGGVIGKLHKLGKKEAQVVLKSEIVLVLRPRNLQRA